MRPLAVVSLLAALAAVQCGPRAGEREDAASPRVVKVPSATGTDESKQTGPLAVAQVGHSAEVWAIAWSPTGDRIATGSFDHSLRIWTDQGRMLGVLRGHREAITELAFGPRGDVLASADRHARVRIWDLHHAGKYLELTKAGDHVAFSPDGSRLVAVGFDLLARIYDVKNGKLVHTLHFDRGRQLRSVAWSHDGHRIAACSLDGPLAIWNAEGEAQTPIVQSMCAGGALQELAYSPDGRLASAGGRLVVLEADGKTSHTLERKGLDPYQLVWSSDGKKVFTNGGFGQAQVWDVGSARYERAISHPGYLSALAVSPKGDRIALGGKMPVKSRDGGNVEIPVARIYDIKTGKMQGHLEGSARPVTCASWNPSGDTLLTCSPELVTWDARTGQKSRVLYPPGATSSVWNPKQPLLAITGRRFARVLDSGTGKELVSLSAEEPGVVWSPDGATLAVVSQSSLTLWDTATRKTKSIAQPARTYLRDGAFSVDSKELIVAVSAGLEAYSVATGQRVRTFALKGRVPTWRNPESLVVGAGGTVAATLNGPGLALFDADGGFRALVEDRSRFALPAFTPDGTRVAYAAGNVIRIWGARDGVGYAGHDAVLRSIAWSSTGDRFATSSDDGSVRLWRPGQTEALHVFSSYEGRVWTVAWHASDKALLGQGNEAQIHRLNDAQTLRMLVTPGASAAAWYTDAGEYAGDETALALAFLRPSDDLLAPTLSTQASSWKARPELLSELK